MPFSVYSRGVSFSGGGLLTAVDAAQAVAESRGERREVGNKVHLHGFRGELKDF